MKIAVLGSTKGTDLQAIIDAIEGGSLSGVEISFVLSNVADAPILERARKRGIEAVFLDPKGKKREEYDKEIDALLEKSKVELVLLIGYMKLLSGFFVEKWGNRTMNIHPSLLPMFAGGMDLNVHQAVLGRGCKVSGCTLIFVDEGADTGPIIMQKVVDVSDGDTADSLKARVQKAEQEVLVEAVGLFRDGKVALEGKKVRILK